MNETFRSNWKITDLRFVAFIDILGFKDSVMRSTHDNIYKQLVTINKLKKKLQLPRNFSDTPEFFRDTEVYTVNFSDSIVIFSKGNTIAEFENFLIMVRHLFGHCIKCNIPVKGGIAYGEISVNIEDQIYFGQPIIDAYLLEEEVNFFGVALHNTADKYITENSDQIQLLKYFPKIIFTSKVHLKHGKICHSCLSWFKILITTFDSDDFELKKSEVLNKLKWFYGNCSGNPRRYVDNTIELFEDLLKHSLINLNTKT